MVVVNQALAARYFPGREPLGAADPARRRATSPWRTIVGVAGERDERRAGAAAAAPGLRALRAAADTDPDRPRAHREPRRDDRGGPPRGGAARSRPAPLRRQDHGARVLRGARQRPRDHRPVRRCSRAWPSASPRSGSTASSRTRSASARARSGCGWPWAPPRRTSCAWCSARACVSWASASGSGLLVGLGLSRVMASVLVGVSPTDPLTFTVVPLVLARSASWPPRFPRAGPRASIPRWCSGPTAPVGGRVAGRRPSGSRSGWVESQASGRHPPERGDAH